MKKTDFWMHSGPRCHRAKSAIGLMIPCALGQIFPIEKNLHENKMGCIIGFYLQKMFLSFASFLGSVYEASWRERDEQRKATFVMRVS